MIPLRSEEEIASIRQADQIVADVLATLAEMMEPGRTTAELDQVAETMIRDAGGAPAFLGYRGFPATICISIDDEIVHGIPGARPIQDGSIVSVDVGVCWDGYFGDAALTVPCGAVDAERRRLMVTTDRALARGIAAACAGNYLVDISRAVEQTCVAEGFSVVRCFVGHGIGKRLHEEPQIPNFDTGNKGPLLRAGMVLAIEPMVNVGVPDVRVRDDGWTAVTADGRPSAHFEHSVVVREHAAEILSLTPRRRWGQDLG